MVTRRQKQVLDFLRAYIDRHGYAPSLGEIGAALGLGSLATVHTHLQRLERKGLVRRRPRQSRALELVDPSPSGVRAVPLLGRVAAGAPIDAVETPEELAVPEALLGRGETFALRVVGDSMKDDGILDGDIVVVERRDDAPNGTTVVALVRGEATVKRLERARGQVRLLPANAAMQPIVAPEDQVQVRGVVVGLLRRYR